MRIVSLCPSLTELVFDFGRGDTLVGRTKFCVHPADRVDTVERVGGTKNPALPRILALRPDLVLMNEEENRREDAEALAAAGIRVHASFPRDALDTAAMVRDIAHALDAAEAGERIAAAIETRAAAVRGAADQRRAAGEPPVRWAYLIWRRPWMAAGGDTFVSALLELAGGVNVFARHPAERPERYPTITEAELAAADPTVVLLATEPFPFADRHADELAAATGLPRARFRIVDGELLSWHGSRTIAGIDYAATALGAPAA